MRIKIMQDIDCPDIKSGQVFDAAISDDGKYASVLYGGINNTWILYGNEFKIINETIPGEDIVTTHSISEELLFKFIDKLSKAEFK